MTGDVTIPSRPPLSCSSTTCSKEMLPNASGRNMTFFIKLSYATCTQLLCYTTIQPSKKPRVLTETHIKRVKKWQNSVQEVYRIEDSDFKTVWYRNGKNHRMWQGARELKAWEEYRVLDMSAVEYGHELIQNKNKIVGRKYSSCLRSMIANVYWPPFAQLYPPLVSILGMERGALGLVQIWMEL